MSLVLRTRRFLLLAALVSGVSLIGCGGSETVTIEFPEAGPIPESSTTPAQQEAGSQISQGDPAQYSR